MKQLKSRARDLHDLFGGMTVKYIAEKLECRDSSDDASVVRAYMEQRDFDLMGIKCQGNICGYVTRSGLQEGSCSDYQQPFALTEIIADSTPLIDLFQLLRDRPSMFLLTRDRVHSIVTRGDLQKAPVRMFLFGLITLLEMHFLRFIRSRYPNDSWKELLASDNEGRNQLKSARSLFSRKQKRNEEIDLAECLYFKGKALVILHTSQILEKLSVTSEQFQAFIEPANELRNNLAHGSDMVQNLSWPQVIDLASEVEQLLERSEATNSTDSRL